MRQREKIEQYLEETKVRLERAIREHQMKEGSDRRHTPGKADDARVGHRHPNTIALESGAYLHRHKDI